MTAPVSPTEGDPRDAVLAEARRLAVDALYSEKGHFEAASAWRGRTYWLAPPPAPPFSRTWTRPSAVRSRLSAPP